MLCSTFPSFFSLAHYWYRPEHSQISTQTDLIRSERFESGQSLLRWSLVRDVLVVRTVCGLLTFKQLHGRWSSEFMYLQYRRYSLPGWSLRSRIAHCPSSAGSTASWIAAPRTFNNQYCLHSGEFYELIILAHLFSWRNFGDRRTVPCRRSRIANRHREWSNEWNHNQPTRRSRWIAYLRRSCWNKKYDMGHLFRIANESVMYFFTTLTFGIFACALGAL